MTHPLLLSLLMAACAPRPPAAPESAFSPLTIWQAPPQLPSPEAPVYTRATREPHDPAVRAVIGDRRWDEALSGAAAGLALANAQGTGGVELWEVREALWRAGYAHPAQRLGIWRVPRGTPPPDALETLLAKARPGDDVGLTRARGATEDVWVALVARPEIPLGKIARVVALGGEISLPAVPGSVATVGDPDGGVSVLPLDGPAVVVLDLEGEWLLDVAGVRFPVYAGSAPAVESLLALSPTVRDAPAALAEAERQLARVRHAFSLPPLARSPLDDSAARAGGGFACEAASVPSCLDAVVWDVRARSALVSADSAWLGLHAEVEGGRVRLSVVVSQDPVVDSAPIGATLP